MAPQLGVQPSLDTVREVLSSARNNPHPPNIVPLCSTISFESAPVTLYWKIREKSKSKHSFLFESAVTSGTIGRFSFIGVNPRKILKSGPGHGKEEDPLPALDAELSQFREATVPGLSLPPLTGGGIGYIGYDCVRYFEPRTRRDMKDVLGVPESLFMLFDTVVAIDHFHSAVKVITYVKVPTNPDELPQAYDAATKVLGEMVAIVNSPDAPFPPQPSIKLNQEYTSNIGQAGYEGHVIKLKEHICKGDIIQAVPSQRLSRPTSLHPFNIYRHLRFVNPSPYLFFVDCEDFQIIGASPELLVKSERGRIVTHPIAGTIGRSTSDAEDEALAEELRASVKDRAEHVMLVDLARNDVNRVCDPLTTRVDRLMIVQRFSHVQHLTSEVSGVLREGKTRFDAFRSIFPAGTVSGAPKVRAMELIAELEKEKRGVYAGAVGYFGYSSVDSSGKIVEGAMDTCIALRTMLYKNGTAYLQAGGGCVFDSDPYDEYIETLNKLGANVQCITKAEEHYAALEKQAQNWGLGEGDLDVAGPLKSSSNGADVAINTPARKCDGHAHIDLAAG